jgi:hypothetical protein
MKQGKRRLSVLKQGPGAAASWENTIGTFTGRREPVEFGK